MVCEALGASVHGDSDPPTSSCALLSKRDITVSRPSTVTLPRSRALQDAFVSPGGAVRERRERSRSVDRGSIPPQHSAVSNIEPVEGTDCSIM